jgi:CubicO group peptidase (beta-lactamase class C family)
MKRYILTALILFISAINAVAHTDTSGYRLMRSRLDTLAGYLDSNKYLNGNILVAADGKKIYARSIGYRQLDPQLPLTENSIFELASVSKQFTAVGILKLIDKQKLSLDQDIQTILPQLPYKDITVRNLLNHTSGLPDYMGLFEKQWDKTKIATNADVLSLLKQYKPPVLFAPGAKWEYSNTGYAVLASIIEKISRKSYQAYMQDEVFSPLGMTNSFIYCRRQSPRAIADYAYGYVIDEEGKVMLPDSIKELSSVYYLDGIQGDGTVNTNVSDLLKWNNAIHERKLISAKLWEEAMTPGKLKDGTVTSYGFGLMIKANPTLGKVITHNGGWPGYVTTMTNYLDKNIVVIILTNVEGDPDLTQAAFTAVARIATGRSFELPAPVPEKIVASIDTSIYYRYVGIFSIKDFALTVRTRDGKLFIQGTGQPEIEVLPESETKFFVQGYAIEVEFKPEADGSIKSLFLNQGGITEFKKQ